MKRLKDIYINNSIVQFWVSYIIVLILPLIILTLGFRLAFNVTEQDISESNITMLNHSKNLLDLQIKEMEAKALQISQNPKVWDLAEQTQVNSDFFQKASLAINEYYNLMRYENFNIIDDSCVYMENSQYAIYQNSLYKLSNLDKYIKSKYNMSTYQWKQICLDSKNYTPFYTNINDSLQYIKPFSTQINGNIIGSIVIDINDNELKKVLNFDEKSNERSIFIYNEDNKVIWQEDPAGYKNKLNGVNFLGQDLIREDGLLVVHSSSNVTKWNFVVVIPEKVAMKKLNQLKDLIIILISLALALGVGLSLYMSIIKGKPINEIFNIYIKDEDVPRNFKNLGGMLSKIVNNNQELLEEIELDKPMLQHAFLNKLIKGDFVNEKELNILAKRVDMEINCTRFRVVSFKIFLNNDPYELDYQTLEEVQVLFHLIQRHIIDRSKGAVWFYESDYLTTLAIFHINEDEQADTIKTIVEEVHELMLIEYSVDSAWGISCICKNILDIWRACEEAKTANINWQKQRITKYSKELSEKDEMYYPDLIQEKIINSLNAADISNIESLIDILHKENFRNRNISKETMLKLNNMIILTLTSNFSTSQNIKQEAYEMEELIKNYDAFEYEYFKKLKLVCNSLCGEMQKKKKTNQNKLIQKIVNYINEEYANSNLGLSLISSKFNISEGYVSTIFKGNMGINFTDYVEKVRMDCACKLLENSNETISTIAEQVGYNSVQSFRRAFKKIKGISPKELRNNQNVISL